MEKVRVPWAQEVPGSNPGAPTKPPYCTITCRGGISPRENMGPSGANFLAHASNASVFSRQNLSMYCRVVSGLVWPARDCNTGNDRAKEESTQTGDEAIGS
jgi:hypothetical protein